MSGGSKICLAVPSTCPVRVPDLPRVLLQIFTKAWCAYLSLPLSKQRKLAVLSDMKEHILPHVSAPWHLADFLTDAFDLGTHVCPIVRPMHAAIREGAPGAWRREAACNLFPLLRAPGGSPAPAMHTAPDAPVHAPYLHAPVDVLVVCCGRDWARPPVPCEEGIRPDTRRCIRAAMSHEVPPLP